MNFKNRMYIETWKEFQAQPCTAYFIDGTKEESTIDGILTKVLYQKGYEEKIKYTSSNYVNSCLYNCVNMVK